jgi:hypothetical protein
MVDWEVTATTIFCESVNDEVTVIVSGDGTVKCSGRQKYEKPGKEVKKALKTRSKAVDKTLACLGETCAAVKQYRDKMLSEK